MSRESYERLRDLVDGSDFVDTGTPASEEKIAQAEEFLGLTFPEDYRRFLREWGTLAIGPNEYYGIAGDSFESSSVPNGIWFTAVERREVGLPSSLIVLVSREGDQYVCVDAGNPGEPRVVVWDVGAREVSGVWGDDLFEFILEDAEDFL